MTKQFFLLGMLFAILFDVSAQSLSTISLSATLTNSDPTDYESCEHVEMLPGFSTNASKPFNAKVDPDICLEDYLVAYGCDEANWPNIELDLYPGHEAGNLEINGAGQAIYTYPIEGPPGIGGHSPNISLIYNSSMGYGVMGKGWAIGGLSMISRSASNQYFDGRNDFGELKFNSTDNYTLDGKRLILVSGVNGKNGSEYRKHSEDYTRIIAKGNNLNSGPEYFEVTSKGGTKYYYGLHLNGRPKLSNGVITSWCLNRIEDKNGNYTDFSWEKVDGINRVIKVEYGGNIITGKPSTNKFVFEYEYEFPYPNKQHGLTGIVQNKYLLSSIKVSSDENELWEYKVWYSGGYKDANIITRSITRIMRPCNTLKNPTFFAYKCFELAIQKHGQIGGNTNFTNPDNIYIPTDLNADGFTDIFQVHQLNNGGQKVPRAYTIHLNQGNNIFQNLGGGTMIGRENFLAYKYNNGAGDFKFNPSMNPYSYDLDGDGLNELILPVVEINSNSDRFLKEFVIISVNNGSVTEHTIDIKSKIGNLFSVGQDFSFLPYVTNFNSWISDFDGDGRVNEIIFTTSSDPAAANLGAKTFYFNFLTEYLSEVKSTNGLQNFAEDDISTTGKYPVMDNSSITSLISYDHTTRPGLFYAIHGNNGGGIEAEIRTISIDLNTANPVTYRIFRTINSSQLGHNIKAIRLGDFNGDGLTDIFRFSTNYYAGYSIFYSKADGSLDENNSYQDWIHFDEENSVVLDANGDGMADMVTRYYTANQIKNVVTLSSGYSNGLEAASVIKVNQAEASDLNKNFPLVDFNGDGRFEFLLRHQDNNKTELISYSFLADPVSSLMVAARNGSNITSRVNYKYYVSDLPNMPQLSYPLRYQKYGMYLAHELVPNDKLSRSIKHFYEGLILDLTGLGPLGFLEIKTLGLINGEIHTKSVAENTLDIPNSIIMPSKSTSYSRPYWDLNGQFVKVNEQSTVFNYNDLGNKRFRLDLFEVDQTNFLTGNSVKTTYSGYDNFGNNKSKQENVNNGESIQNQTTTAYISNGSWCPYLPVDITKSYYRNGMAFNEAEEFTYDLKGRLTKYSQRPNTNKFIETDYTYTDEGNVADKTVTGGGSDSYGNILPIVSKSYVYDVSGRFVVKITDQDGDQVSYNRESTRGQVVKEIANNGLEVVHEYDCFGRLSRTVPPIGNEINYSLDWYSNSGSFVLKEGVSQQPFQTAYELVNLTKGDFHQRVNYDLFGNQLVTTEIFDEFGRKIKEVLPRLIGVNPEIEWNYDHFGRLIHNDFFNQITSISYSGNETTTTGPDGKVKSQKNGAFGEYLEGADNGGSISYSYGPVNNVIAMNTNTSVMESGSVNITFDPVDMSQQTLQDPAAGTVVYSYDTYNRLGETTTSQGQVRTQYDAKGRRTRQDVGSKVYQYEYYNQGGGDGLIKKITGPNGVMCEFVYNQYGQIISKIEKFDNVSYEWNYTYNSDGLIKSKSFPGGYTESYEYLNGEFYQTLDNNNNLIWGITSIHETGGIKTAVTGSNQSLTISRNSARGNILGVEFPGAINESYSFDYSTGNCLSRTNLINGQTESFDYDNLDRLTKATVTGLGNSPYVSSEVSYSKGGNISYKNNVGNYVYDPAKKYAIQKIGRTPSTEIPFFTNQRVSYDELGNPLTISEAGFLLTFEYGYDMTRRRATLNDPNGNLVWTRYYFEDFEIIEDHTTGIKRVNLNITGPRGLSAIVSQEANQPDKTFYVIKDYLGSIRALVDVNGLAVETHSYTPWGLRRDANDWTSVISPNHNGSLINFRGFTSHEHLDEFGIIHMNGRLYDPVLARMFSPDNYIQDPSLTQNFNRYTYVLNNPLKYTDPSGDFAMLLALGVFTLGSTLNHVLNPNDYDGNLGQRIASGAKEGVNGFNQVQSATQFNLYNDGKTAVSLGLSMTGLGFGFNISHSFGDRLILGTGLGLGQNPNISGQHFEARFSYYGSLSDKQGIYSLSYGSTTFGGQHGQTVGTIGIKLGDLTVRHSNDFFNGRTDDFRTAQLEIGYKNLSVGVQIYTEGVGGSGGHAMAKTDAQEGLPIWASRLAGVQKDGLGSYINSRVITSALYLGYDNGLVNSRIGIDHWYFQDVIQNNWHNSNAFRKMNGGVGSPYIRTDYNRKASLYGFDYLSNPYSLY